MSQIPNLFTLSAKNWTGFKQVITLGIKRYQNYVHTTLIQESGAFGLLNCSVTCYRGHSQSMFTKEVGRWSKNVNFYKVETVSEGGYVVQKFQNLST